MDSPEYLCLRHKIDTLALSLGISYEEVVRKALKLYFFSERCTLEGNKLALVIPEENIDSEFDNKIEFIINLLLTYPQE